MKYKLQKEIENALQESATLVGTYAINGSDAERELASKYFNAIKRINDVCVNRNRY